MPLDFQLRRKKLADRSLYIINAQCSECLWQVELPFSGALATPALTDVAKQWFYHASKEHNLEAPLSLVIELLIEAANQRMR